MSHVNEWWPHAAQGNKIEFRKEKNTSFDDVMNNGVGMDLCAHDTLL